jgi:hypothetical protein
MIPKKPAPDLIRGGNRLSEKDHARTKSQTMIPIQLDRIMVQAGSDGRCGRKITPVPQSISTDSHLRPD